MTARLSSVLALSTVIAATGAAAAPLVEIGTTVTVRNSVMVEYEADKRRLDRGDQVHQNEAVQTSRASLAEIRLLDETKLAVGPESRVVLDTFVYDARATPGTTAIRMAKGAFRFISGNNPSSTYQVITPSAAIGVRGTIFDTYVAANLDTLILLHEGVIEVCASPTNCRLFSTRGGLVHVSSQGEITFPRRFENRAVRNASVETAFPFVGRALIIDPVPRLRHTMLLRPYRPSDHAQDTPPKGSTGTGPKSRTGDSGGAYPSGPGTNKGTKKTGHVDKGSVPRGTNTLRTTKTLQKTPQATKPKIQFKAIQIRPQPKQIIK